MGLFNRDQTTQRRSVHAVRTDRNTENSDLQYKAKSKLIGAVVLALLGVLILPFIFSNDEPINQAETTAQAPLVSPSGQTQMGTEGNISISAAPGVLAGEANTATVTTGAVVTNPTSPGANGATVSGVLDSSDLTVSTQIPQSVASSVGTLPPVATFSTETPASVAASTATPEVSTTEPSVSVATNTSKTTEARSQNKEKKAEPKRKEVAKNIAKDTKRTNTIKDENRTDDGSVALALLEGRVPSQAKATTKSTASVKKGSYSVQVAAFSSMDEARLQRDRLSSSGVSNAFVQSAVVNGRQTYRLRVGPFTSHESAQAALTRLRGLGHSGFITGN